MHWSCTGLHKFKFHGLFGPNPFAQKFKMASNGEFDKSFLRTRNANVIVFGMKQHWDMNTKLCSSGCRKVSCIKVLGDQNSYIYIIKLKQWSNPVPPISTKRNHLYWTQRIRLVYVALTYHLLLIWIVCYDRQ